MIIHNYKHRKGGFTLYPKVYFEGKLVFNNLDKQTIEEMVQRGWVIKGDKGEYILVENREHKHLFHSKIPLGKRLGYFKQLNKKKCHCEDCNAPFSMHIRPAIFPDGTINFKEIICVCKECRTKKLEQQDILVPQFRKDFSNKALNTEIKEELHQKYGENGRVLNAFLTDKKFFEMKRQEKRMYSLTKIPLPPMPKRERSYAADREMLNSLGIKNMHEELNLNLAEVRVNVRKYLSFENDRRCPCCGKQTDVAEYTIDHIKPKSQGGKNIVQNFIGMCKECNEDKGKTLVLEYLRKREFKALPERILKIAYKEQELAKKQYQEFSAQVAEYEKKRADFFTA